MKPTTYECEAKYHLLMALTLKLLSSNVISEQDCSIIDKKLADLYAPLIGRLAP